MPRARKRERERESSPRALIFSRINVSLTDDRRLRICERSIAIPVRVIARTRPLSWLEWLSTAVNASVVRVTLRSHASRWLRTLCHTNRTRQEIPTVYAPIVKTFQRYTLGIRHLVPGPGITFPSVSCTRTVAMVSHSNQLPDLRDNSHAVQALCHPTSPQHPSTIRVAIF